MQCGTRKLGWFSGLVAMLAVGAFVASVARAEADTSTPKKAAIAFAKAVQDGDQAAVKALSTGTEAEYALVKSISELAAGMKKLEEASVKKFGPEGKLPKEMALDMVGDMESAEEKIEGDNATLLVKSKPDDKFPPTLKKDGAGWKMDLTNLDKDPQAAAMAPMLPMMVKAMDTVTKSIDSGKYKTVAEAMADLGAQMAGGATPPGEPPK